MTVAIAELEIADPPEAWRSAGYAVDDEGVCLVGSVRLRLVGRDAGKGIVGWALSGVAGDLSEVDGVSTGSTAGGGVSTGSTSGDHPNGVTSIDHVVLMTPDLARTIAALGEIGLAPRRERDGELGGAAVRQVFYRLGEVILEVVGSPDTVGEGPASLWGITFNVADLDATAAMLGEGVGRVKDAVQPGRRITTLRHQAFGITVPTAYISAPAGRP